MKRQTTIYANGAVVRLHNRRISFRETEKDIDLMLEMFDQNAADPGSVHHCLKGKIRVTNLRITKEAFHELIAAYIAYEQEPKFKTPKKRKKS